MNRKSYEPLRIGNSEIKNRFIMGSMHTGLEEHPNGYEAMAAFYAERAKGEVGLIITGGISPNNEGKLWPGASAFTTEKEVPSHRIITSAVHEAGGKIALQILHTGRYGVHENCVSASELQAPINLYKPKALSIEEIQQTIQDFARCARLAEQAGYDGVEIMGSEGYFLHQFTAPRTNKRTDAYGGSFENRIRLPLEVVRAIREAVSDSFMLIYRISVVDLVEEGSSKDEIISFAKALETAGVHLLNTGIGWHEARIPTISMRVPRGAFVWAAELLKQHVSIPVSATNRINTPELAEEIIESGRADAVSLARPLLADPNFVQKGRTQRSSHINTCVACNQACLDQIFSGEIASCLVNPFACRELTWKLIPTETKKRVAVIGAGVGGLNTAWVLAKRGFEVEVFEKKNHIGGQLYLAASVPGKEEFHETLRYFSEELNALHVPIHLNAAIQSLEVLKDFDTVVATTGVVPTALSDMPSDGSVKVWSYTKALENAEALGNNVVILGSGGIAMDTASKLAQHSESIEDYEAYWGIDSSLNERGALVKPAAREPLRKVTIIQRSAKKLGQQLGKTTVWSHRTELQQLGVKVVSGIENLHVSECKVQFNVGGNLQQVEATDLVLCIGQTSEQPLGESAELVVLGGARDAARLDAKRVIYETTKWAISY